MKLKFIKLHYMLLILFLLSIIVPILVWIIMPKRTLNVLVLSKTLTFTESSKTKEKTADYSMHRGLFWIMDYLKIKNPSTKSAYNHKTDYYGNFISAEGNIYSKSFDKIEQAPDIIYLSDTYGTGKSKINGNEEEGISGLTDAEVSLISACYVRGTTIIGEYNVAGEPTMPGVSKELENIFNIEFSGWTGRFFSELSSSADVPEWLRAAYEQRYGLKWKLSGAGLVLVSNSDIIVLRRGIDFNRQSIRIEMTEENEKKFNTSAVNYYNWFEIVKPKSEEMVLAWYDMNLTESGIEQMEDSGLSGRFPAVIHNPSGVKNSYYLAGNFNEYREPSKIKFLYGAPSLYRRFSIDEEGDYTYFYWNFYVPFINKVFKEVEKVDEKLTSKATAEDNGRGTILASKVTEGSFSVYQNGQWVKLFVKGVDIGDTFPGQKEGSFPEGNSIYRQWFEEIGNLNANAIRVYSLMPPGFYLALDEYNMTHPDKKLYLFQNISVRQQPSSGSYLDEQYNKAFRQEILNTIDAMHGNLKIEGEEGESSKLYVSDVSGYLLGYLIDPRLNPDNVAASDKNNPAFKYSGEFISASMNSTNTEAWLASLCDEVYKYEQSNYKMQHPTAFTSIPELDILYHDKSGCNGMDDGVSVDINNIETTSKLQSGFFGAYSIFPDHPGFMVSLNDNTKLNFEGYRQYMKKFMETQKKYPVLVSEFGLSTSVGASQKAAEGYTDGNNSEEEQGHGIVKMMDIIKESGAMGGLIYQWNDEWGKSSRFSSSLIIPYERNSQWHDITDPAQNYGIMAVRSEPPKKNSITLRAPAPLKTIAYAADPSYFYITAEFDKLPNLVEKDIVLYLDTVDRNKGEYMLAPNIPETWTGSEFSVRIQNESKADLLVIPEYNSTKGSYYTKVKSEGIFERMQRLLSAGYTTKEGNAVSPKYEDASTLKAGSFQDSDTSFRFEGKTLYLRLPWIRLNFTDPSSFLVLDDEENKGIYEGSLDKLKVRMTDGIVTSLIIMDKNNQSVEYHFPESVYSAGYRTFSWKEWDIPKYITTYKKSYDIIKAYFEK